MIKRPFRDRKVPLVFGGQWKDHQTFQKWDPISKRLIQVNCCLPSKPVPPTPCTLPNPVSNVTLRFTEELDAEIYWGGNPGQTTNIEINIYESSTLPVDTSRTPFFSEQGEFTNPSIIFPFIGQSSGYYYVASVRVLNNCGYSTYVYSDTIQY